MFILRSARQSDFGGQYIPKCLFELQPKQLLGSYCRAYLIRIYIYIERERYRYICPLDTFVSLKPDLTLKIIFV